MEIMFSKGKPMAWSKATMTPPPSPWRALEWGRPLGTPWKETGASCSMASSQRLAYSGSCQCLPFMAMGIWTVMAPFSRQRRTSVRSPSMSCWLGVATTILRREGSALAKSRDQLL